jgi:phosphate transport system substrate-binding protein
MRLNTSLAASALALAASALAGCGGQQSGTRENVRAVGSSTVLPFAKAVSEQLARSNPGIPAPIIESTGTGAGMKLFCAGVGASHPDIENASRRMKRSEYDDCARNGVKDIAEIQVGLDGIAFAEAQGGLNLDLILAKGCESDAAMKALKDSDKARYDANCTEVREDGAYVDSGENDNLIVQKLEANPQAIGVFGFSYLEANSDKLKGLKIGGVVPTYATISDFTYPGARPLYIYVKKAHLGAIRGLKEFVAEWAKSWGKGGLLAKAGMVVAPDDVQAASAKVAADFTSLDPASLK